MKARAKSKKRAKPKIDITRMKQTELARMLHISVRAIGAWQDCPRNEDKTYDLSEVWAWRLQQIEERAAKREAAKATGDAKGRKYDLDCQLRELEIENKKKNVYPRDFVHSIAAQQATALREFWQTGWRREAAGIVQQLGLPASSIPALVSCLENLVIEMMERWCAAGKEIDTTEIGG